MAQYYVYILLLVIKTSGYTQKQEGFLQEITYTLPIEYNYYGKLNSLSHNPKTFYLADKFYPIGWSKDGKLAYFLEYANEACDCYRANLIIKDMVIDKTIWEYKFNNEGDEEWDKDNLNTLWKEKYILFQEYLSKHKIIQQKHISVQEGINIQHETSNFTIKHDIEKQSDPDWPMVIKENVVVINKSRKQKRVHSKNDPHSIVLDSKIYGIIKSPFENRIAIMFKRMQRGWEGPPHVYTYDFAGCSLEASTFR